MSTSPPAEDVVVVGGGVIGLAVAWRTRLCGLSVSVLERRAVGEECAATVAAGMLAPVSEVEFGEVGRDALRLGLRSAEAWPTFAAELEEAAGVEVGLRRGGTLLVARDSDEARELERGYALRQSLGLGATRLRPSAARELEPALAPTVRLAVEVPADHSVDPRRLLVALRRACACAGVRLREHAHVRSIELAGGEDDRVTGVTLADGEHVQASCTILAAGAWTAALEGLPAYARVPVRPVKGQILRLRDPDGPGLLRRVLRYAGGYLVPRGDGRYVLGATVEERGFEQRPTAGGIYELLRYAHELVPGIRELQIDELSVGYRPSTPDNLPAVGRGVLDGLCWATGHHRNGILLAPITAELLARELASQATEPQAGGGLRRDSRAVTTSDDCALLAACDPRRFAAMPSAAGLSARGSSAAGSSAAAPFARGSSAAAPPAAAPERPGVGT